MAAKKLITSDTNYAGKYVATASFNTTKVIASGKDPKGVISRANKKGCESPVVFFVPDKNTLHIY